MGVSPKWEKKEKRERERKKERLNNGDNNGQATHGARMHAWHTQAAWAKRCLNTIVHMLWVHHGYHTVGQTWLGCLNDLSNIKHIFLHFL